MRYYIKNSNFFIIEQFLTMKIEIENQEKNIGFKNAVYETVNF